jgi:hypothetical protein
MGDAGWVLMRHRLLSWATIFFVVGVVPDVVRATAFVRAGEPEEGQPGEVKVRRVAMFGVPTGVALPAAEPLRQQHRRQQE